jgi:hypothetical protein
MKRLHFFKVGLLLTFLTICTKSYGHWYELNVDGLLIPFSKIAKEGKVSVFILGTPSCGPCHRLKTDLKAEGDFDMNKVDFYYVNMAHSIKEIELEYMPSAKIWKGTTGMNAFPQTFILDPVTNIVTRGNFTFDVIKNNVQQLVKLFAGIKLDEVTIRENSKPKKLSLVLNNEPLSQNSNLNQLVSSKTIKNQVENLRKSENTLVEVQNHNYGNFEAPKNNAFRLRGYFNYPTNTLRFDFSSNYGVTVSYNQQNLIFRSPQSIFTNNLMHNIEKHCGGKIISIAHNYQYNEMTIKLVYSIMDLKEIIDNKGSTVVEISLSTPFSHDLQTTIKD